MYVCPKTGCRLIKARIKGGLFWYSPESDGRLMTISTVKHYLGEHAASEIWMRSESSKVSSYKCPGCLESMREVLEPEWVGPFHIDVCRKCWFVWFDHDEHPEIPKGSSIDGNVEKIKQQAAKTEVTYLDDLLKSKSAQPDHLLHMIAGIFLPTKTVWRGLPILTFISMIVLILTYPYFNRVSSADISFFAFNVYFFYLFSSDLEVELEAYEYLASLALGGALPFVVSYFFKLGPYDFGLLPLNVCLMIMAVFLPLKAKFSYLFPAIHYFQIPNEGFIGRIKGSRWIHIPQWLLVTLYMLIGILWMFLLSNSTHYAVLKTIVVSEALLGVCLGLLLAKIEKINA